VDTKRRGKQRGFQRWYERRLFESFGWLALCLMSGVLFAAVLEFVGLKTPGLTPMITLVFLYVVVLMGITAWRRFWAMLTHAQRCANAATCQKCGAYGLFDVEIDAGTIPATCRKCGHHWIIAPERESSEKPQ
jgi:hypothetical protein